MPRRKRTRKLRPKTPARIRKKKRPGVRRTAAARPAHHHELWGLALLALGLFLACVLYLDWEGGVVGGAVADATLALIGWGAYVAPAALVVVGGLMVARSGLVDVRPFRTGLAFAIPGLLLTLGASQGGHAGRGARARSRLGGRPDRRRPRRGDAARRRDPPALGRVDRRRPPPLGPRPPHAHREPPPRAPAPGAAARRGRHVGAAGAAAPPVDAEHDFPDVVETFVQPPLLVEDDTHEQEPEHDDHPSLFDAKPTTAEYVLPDRRVLQALEAGRGRASEANDRLAGVLVETLAHFGIDATVVGQIAGPRVTRYELQLAPGTKVSKVAALKDDLSYALATTEIRILAPIPGKQAVGVEIPNASPNLVTLGDIYDDLPATASPLSVWLGKDISGTAVWADLARMPHILLAGTTGSGKSGCINTILTSILLRSTPEEVRMILIDPKRIELNYYESIPHLLTPVVSSPKEASAVLTNVVAEMERRYERLSFVRARNLPEANRAFRKRNEDTLPYLLVVIDELADLMMVSPQAVEDAVIRLAQKSRAVGIHLVLATQRPSVDVITGMIKANVPSRIAFAVSSQTDSRVILDQSGAEALLGQGDMLFKPLGTSRLQRVQGAFVSEEEVALVVEQARVQREQQLDESLLELPEVFTDADDDVDGDFDPDEDPLLDKAIEIAVQTQTASVSLLQRRLRVGYTRAGRLIDMLERRGIISGYEGSKPRRVLVTEEDLARVLASQEV